MSLTAALLTLLSSAVALASALGGPGRGGGRGKRALIVEGDDGVRARIAEVLGDTYECASAATADEALELLARRTFHIVLADADPPGLPGFDLVCRLHALRPGVRVVVMSDETLDVTRDWGEHGVIAYLQKPLDYEQLGRSVRLIVERDWRRRWRRRGRAR